MNKSPIQINNLKIVYSNLYGKWQVITPDKRILDLFYLKKKAIAYAKSIEDFILEKKKRCIECNEKIEKTRSNRCKSCRYKRMREYTKKYMKDYMKKWYAENREKHISYAMKYNQKNADRTKKYDREYMKKYREKNKEYFREYKRKNDNPLNRIYKITKEEFKELTKECKRCNFNEVVMIHHIIPTSMGGKNQLTNLIGLCPNCHALLHKGKISVNDILKEK